MRWLDVSNANTPYDEYGWNVAWDGVQDGRSILPLVGLGQTDPESPDDVVDVSEIPCDFTEGAGVVALQQALVEGGYLDEGAVSGKFDEATCSAWAEHYGAPPDPKTLAEVVLGPDVACPNVVMPACPGLERRGPGLGWGQMFLVAGVVAGALYLWGKSR